MRRRHEEPGRDGPRWALLLIAAGALGNDVDRIARGYVVDFVTCPTGRCSTSPTSA
ncbi:MAG TPA: signal peptidase II [Polyangia bacterium]|nr:signal peptidase II [Polyangia bacterium]